MNMQQLVEATKHIISVWTDAHEKQTTVPEQWGTYPSVLPANLRRIMNVTGNVFSSNPAFDANDVSLMPHIEPKFVVDLLDGFHQLVQRNNYDQSIMKSFLYWLLTTDNIEFIGSGDVGNRPFDDACIEGLCADYREALCTISQPFEIIEKRVSKLRSVLCGVQPICDAYKVDSLHCSLVSSAVTLSGKIKVTVAISHPSQQTVYVTAKPKTLQRKISQSAKSIALTAGKDEVRAYCGFTDFDRELNSDRMLRIIADSSQIELNEYTSLLLSAYQHNVVAMINKAKQLYAAAMDADPSRDGKNLASKIHRLVYSIAEANGNTDYCLYSFNWFMDGKATRIILTALQEGEYSYAVVKDCAMSLTKAADLMESI